MTSHASPIKNIFTGTWRFIDGARKVFLNLLFLLVLFLVAMAFWNRGEALIIEADTALVLRPAGEVVEQYSRSPLDIALERAIESDRTETRLRDLVEAIRRARDDERITRIVIVPHDTWAVGLASLQELEAAIEDFKTAGKPVVAVADNLTQQQYYLAALADEVWLNPMGMLWLDGFAAYRQYYGEGLNKLEVEVNLFRVGKYKSAAEPFVRDDMSAEAKEANLFWIGNLWQQYLEGISAQRGLPLENLSQAINDFPERLAAANGDSARLALDMGLVDRLISRPEANLTLAGLGAPGRDGEGYRQVDFLDYLAATDLQHPLTADRKVAIVVAEGEIVQGLQDYGVASSEGLTERLRSVAADRSVEAVVLRVDSPGGEVFASERIRQEMQALTETGKTVVVSMGDVAASGGYWISMGADEVWTHPSTITGSIGVFGLLPTFEKSLAKLGIHADGIGTTPQAGKLRLDLPLDPRLERVFQQSTERTYEDFINLVARHRDMSPEAVREIAQGRVWSGAQAKERGLVDQTGTLQQAIDAAARIAGLGSDYDVVYEERKLGAFERFFVDMTAGAMARIGLSLPGLNLPGGSQFESVLEDLGMLTRNQGEFTLAAHCFCGID